jgi:hypothetical protein
LSRQDHRDHDAALLEEREANKARMADSAKRSRKEKRDLTMAIILGLVFFVATLFLKVTLAWFAGFICLFAIAGYIGNLERTVDVKKWKITAIQAAIIIVGTLIESAGLYPVWRKEMAASMEGDLLGANESFDDGQARFIPPVQIGKSGTKIFQPPGSPPFWQPFPDADFKLEPGKRGPMVSTTIRDGDGHIAASIDKNHWKVFAPFCADKNYTNDGLSLEILDSSLHVVFQLRLMPDAVQVQGEWWDNQGQGKRMLEDLNSNRSVLEYLGPRQKKNDDLIKPMFVYPSSDHWEELIKRPTPRPAP